MISKIAVLCMMTRYVVNEGAEEGVDGGAEGADPDDGWRELGWARPFGETRDAMNLTSRISDRVDGDEVMSYLVGRVVRQSRQQSHAPRRRVRIDGE